MKLSENTRYHKYVFVCSINCLSYYLGKKKEGKGGGGRVNTESGGLSKKVKSSRRIEMGRGIYM